MLSVEDYDSGSDGEQTASPPTTKPPLAPVLDSNRNSSSIPPIPTIQTTGKKRAPKKITIGLPDLKGQDEGDDEPPNSKRPKLVSGAGASSLLSMLPGPKQKAPVLPPPTNAVQPVPFRPTSIGQGKATHTLEKDPVLPKSSVPKSSLPAVDFFGIGSNSSSTTASLSSSISASSSLSSAPQIEEFTPPKPSPDDPYPGYYLLPSGSWAAYDPDYYRKYYEKWQANYNAHIRALEKSKVKGFEDLESAGAQEVNALEEMERAQKDLREKEERKAVTHGAEGGLKAPRMNIQGAKLGGRARARHQLTTLLTEAFQNREALEERIAEGKRNRKEAGNKYGF